MLLDYWLKKTTIDLDFKHIFLGERFINKGGNLRGGEGPGGHTSVTVLE